MDAFEEKINRYLNRTPLNFSPDLEVLFDDDYFQKSIGTIRAALVLALVLYAVFGVLDLFLAPTSAINLWIIRYAIVCPVIMLAFAASFLTVFKKIYQWVICIISATAGFGILAMIQISADIQSKLYYYAGLILVIIWSYALARLRFTFAVAVCWTLVVAYSAGAMMWQHALSTRALLNTFINNNFFFISANIIGMLANFNIEVYTRKDFLLRLLIADKQRKLQEERNELRDRNEIMGLELNVTRMIQQQLIPQEAPRGIYSLYRPMEAVGGDFYDFIRFREQHKIGIFICDVSGHGVPSALITSMIKVLILESSRFKDNPARLLSHLNELLADNTGEIFITAFYGVYDYRTRTIIYANAGHHLPLVVTGKKVRTLKNVGTLPLAVFRLSEMKQWHHSFKNRRDVLPADAKLFLFTDGLIDASAVERPRDNFGTYLNDALLRRYNKSSSDLLVSLFDELVRFRGSDTFKDDISMICLDTSVF